MGYSRALLERERRLGHPVRVGIVGAGQMGTGMASTIAKTPGMTVAAIANRTLSKAVDALHGAGHRNVVEAGSDIEAAIRAVDEGRAVAINDGLAMPRLGVDIVVECSGYPEIAAQVAYACITHSKDVALMTIEADITVGLLLASMANAGNSIYTVMRGDEPIEALKLVEYCQDLGFEVICAGKGKNNVNIHTSVPEDNLADAEAKRMNPRMLTEFTDGTKTQLEMAALSNATGMPVEVDGMHGVACNIDQLASTLIPHNDGGILDFSHGPVVEYVTGDVAPGVFAIAKVNDPTVVFELDYLKLGHGPYYLFYRPWHIASVEAPLSIGEAIINRRPDFQSRYSCTEVVGRAKFDLDAPVTLEMMGEHHYFGWAIPAGKAREMGAVPIGLLAGSRLVRPKTQGQIITYDDIELDETRPLVAMRRLQDALIAQGVIGARA